MYLKMMNSNLFAIFSIFSLVVRASDEFMRPSSELGLALERLLKHESFIRLNSAFYGPQLVMQKTVLADILENTDAMKELIEENDVLKKELGRYQ